MTLQSYITYTYASLNNIYINTLKLSNDTQTAFKLTSSEVVDNDKKKRVLPV